MPNLKSTLSALVLAAVVAGPAVAGDDWYRQTGGVSPQLQNDEFYARGTGGVTPQATDDDFYFRGTGGVAPQVGGDDLYSRGTGGVSPQARSE